MPARVRDKPRGVPARCPASPLMPMNAPRGMPLRNAPAPANAPEPPPDRTHAACPFALQRPSLILSQSHVYAACPEQWPRGPSLPTGTLRANAFPVPRETRGKSPRREPTDHIQRRKPHQKPRVERARGLSLARHPRSHQRTTLRAAKETGIPQSVGASSQRRTRPSLPTGTLRANAFPVPRETRGKRPRREPTDRVQRRKAHQKPRVERARGLSLGPPSPQPSTNDSSRRKRNGHAPVCRRIPPKANAPVPPHRDPPHKRLPSPAKRAEKSPRRGPSDHIQRGKSHQKPRAERARGLSLGPPSPQPSTNDSSRRKRNGHPRGAGTSSQRQTRPSLPTGTLRANASRPPRNARQKAPERANRPPPTRKVPPKAAYRKSARPFPWPAIPAAINKRLFAPQKKRASPGAQAHPPKGKCACPSPPGPSARTPPVPREPRSKKAPWEPTDRVQCRAAFSLCSPRLSRNTAANRHVPWEERGLFASTRAVSPAGRF